MSLYDDLGVNPDASPDELRRAHRKGVQRHHPDKGGNREEFEKVQRAYLILRDPKTRQRYDETGEDEIQPDNELAEVANVMVAAFDQAMQEASGSLDTRDLIASMRKILAARKFTAQSNRKILEDAGKGFAKVRDRLSFKGGGADLLSGSLNAKIAETERMAAALAREIETVDRAEAYAADYGYRFDPAPMGMVSQAQMLNEALQNIERGRGGGFFGFGKP